MTKIFLRLTRHPVCVDRKAAIEKIFGTETQIVTEDIKFSDDPVATVKGLIEKFGGSASVIAVEVVAPFPVLMKLVEARLPVPLVRSENARGDDGRIVIAGKDENGRDVFKFSHYVELVKIEFVTRPLVAKK
jgi:hypothetical protein